MVGRKDGSRPGSSSACDTSTSSLLRGLRWSRWLLRRRRHPPPAFVVPPVSAITSSIDGSGAASHERTSKTDTAVQYTAALQAEPRIETSLGRALRAV